MKTITFECETITPMFLSGADGSTPELRPPSIKGALRFWWRAMNGHLGLGELKRIEGEIFGDTGRRSGVVIRVLNDHTLNTAVSELVPHKPFMKQNAFRPKEHFKVLLSINECVSKKETNIFGINQLSALFQLTCLLGGFGKRVRRGMGSVKIKNADVALAPSTLEGIAGLLKQISPHYTISNGSIKTTWQGNLNAYPFIQQIEVGSALSKPTQIISDTTHEFHQKINPPFKYNASLGHAFKGRFASPIYVSVLEGNRTVITSLNTEPLAQQKRDVDPMLQREFKKAILNS